MRGNENLQAARALMMALYQQGLREVVLAPGSRSTPLVVAATEQPEMLVRTIIDERDAAYFAVGLARAGRAAAVITTSGTAVANLHPAVVEADAAALPLLLLTADRPPRLRGIGANQAIHQMDLFGRHVRAAWDAPLPTDPEVHARLGRQAWDAAHGRCPGPVHLNLPFDEPLLPPEPWPAPPPLAVATPAADTGAAVETDAGPSLRGPGIVVAGPCVPDPEALLQWAAEAGAPVFADPLSGCRHGPGHGATIVSSYDAALGCDAAAALRPSWVLRAGAAPTSKSLLAWLSRLEVPQIVLDSHGRRHDATGTATALVDTLGTPPTGGDHGSLEACWQTIDEAVWSTFDAPPELEGSIAAHLTKAAQTWLFVGSSMPVRDMDRFGRRRPEPLAIHGNRGASGIDGNLATAAGIVAASGPGIALVGDLTFQHDVGGLAAVAEHAPELTLVVIQNHGGHIFDHLPIAQHGPPLLHRFTTPQRFDVGKAAEAFGLDHRVSTIEGLQASLAPGVVEVAVDAEVSIQMRRTAQEASWAAVATAVEGMGLPKGGA